MVSTYTQFTGDSAAIENARVVPQDAFGAIYTSYNSFSKFEATFSDLGLSEIRWPGGTLSETRPDRYGFDWEDFSDPNRPDPGLSELMNYCTESDVALSIILPTTRFAGDPASAAQQVASFVDKLLVGGFGEFPAEFTIEIGNEYYAHKEFAENSGAYGQVANAMVEEIATALSNSDRNPNALDLEVAVQMGKTSADDIEIRSQFSELGLASIDELITHRFSWSFEGSDNKISLVESNLEDWAASIVDAGGGDPALFLSAFNTASFTRKNALTAYEKEYESNFGSLPDLTAINLDTRNNDAFENFYQTGELMGPDGQVIQTERGLQEYDYGLAQASNILELYANYSSLGLSSASMYGFGTPYSAHFSDYLDGVNHQFVGSSIVQMMTESLPGTTLLSGFESNHRPEGESGQFNTYTYEDEEKIVMFIAANDISDELGAELSLQVNSNEGVFQHVFVESLQSELQSDWMDVFGIVDNPNVDETNESRNYEKGIRTIETASVEEDVLNLSFHQDFEIKRIVLVKNGADIDAISEWAGQYNELIPLVSYPESNDEIVLGTKGADLLVGEIGDDVYLVNQKGDRIAEDENAGNDTILAKVSVAMARMSTNVENVILKTKTNLSAWGNEMNNDIKGNVGDNHLMGRKGDDYIRGGAGDDTIYGHRGDDRLTGGRGNDHLIGGNGKDTLSGGEGADTLTGGKGNDIFVNPNGEDRVIERKDGGYDAVHSDQSSRLWEQSQHIEKLVLTGNGDTDGVGNSIDNKIVGNHGDNYLRGLAGDDVLSGRDGNDILVGGKGDDTLNGGAGINTLYGGQGNNTFVVGTSQSENTIEDFDPDNDKLNFADEDEEYILESLEGDQGGIKVYYGESSVVLKGVGIDDVGPTNFVFG